ncbi:hypothetical protein SAMN05216323_10168 [Williamwhitmania taraxaci]|uniref:Uncharacterized protein n=1 Tax=Williamwhitmania taraxaci TaxID=1640674 RepID=A0A1G6IHM2_9BACT|nr:hypothetical protein SAMN05216323_10168 [Williamwhitmania taraxaci]
MNDDLKSQHYLFVTTLCQYTFVYNALCNRLQAKLIQTGQLIAFFPYFCWAVELSLIYLTEADNSDLQLYRSTQK